jgi:rhodanese-related sulfurtransferase
VAIVTHREVRDLIAGGAQVVDVLPQREYRSGHIAGAIHIPLRDVPARAKQLLVNDRPVVVYCRDSL